jgi:hypothetical protein
MKIQFLLAFAFLIISINFFHKNENISEDKTFDENIFAEEEIISDYSHSDSSEDLPTPTSPIKDVSNMFNERGYFKSNGFSFDDQEIINDFNGNLMYSIPLYYFSLGGDISLQLKLTYNGSISHIVTTGNTFTISNSLSIYSRRNFNFPEWIVDLNGIAVQTLNFETDFFTNTASPSTYVSGSSVNSLIPGYHYDDELRALSDDNNDRINIMAGDGSIITLENPFYSSNTQDTNNYTGTYFYKGKESYYKAIVSYIYYDPNNIHFNPRKIILLKGDGMEYEFKESYIDFKDFPHNASVNSKIKPMSLYLTEIRDRFSHSIKISYSPYHPYSISDTEHLFGRQLLKSITTSGISATINQANIWLEYGPAIVKMFHQSEINGNFSFLFERPVSYRSFDDNKNQRGYVNKVINILNQQSEFSYYKYTRRYDNLYSQGTNGISVSMNDLKRLSSAKNNLGLVRKYTSYFKQDMDSMSIDLHNYYYDDLLNIMSSTDTSKYKGYGRDLFFTNMLQSKSDSSEVLKSQTDFIYKYSYNSRNDLLTKPIDSSDNYSTQKIITSMESSTLNNSDNNYKTIRTYKVYPLYDPNNHFAYSPDTDGMTKLLGEELFKSDGTNKNKTIIYKYDLGNFTSIPGGFNGSFLMKSKQEYYPGTANPKSWSWEYIHTGGGIDSPVAQTKEIDPFENYSISKDTLYFTSIWHKRFLSDYNYYNIDTILSNYYKINVSKQKLRYDKDNNLLDKKTFGYIEDPNSSLGYYGQLISEK